MKYTPAPHHLAAIDFLISRPSAALWLDMGSGKTGATATVIDQLLDRVEVTRWLVIGTPRIAAKVWFAEMEKWDHLGHIAKRSYHITSEDLPVIRTKTIRNKKEVNVLKLVNTRQTRRDLLSKPAEVFTVHYDLVPRLVKLFGDDWPFDGVVLDESSMVSEQDTARFKALRRIRGSVARFYELTGTPASNGLEKLFTQVYLLDGGRRLGRTLTEFRERFLEPDKRNKDRVFSWKPKPGAREEIYRLIGDIVMSLDPEDWIKLPEIVYNRIPVYLPESAMQLYREVEEEYIATLANGAVLEAATAAVLGNKLLQICNGTVYDDKKQAHAVHNAKLEALEELTEVSNGQVLLAYWYQHDRDRIKAKFKKAVDLADDPDFEAKWNREEIGLGMIQPASGGHGLNLQDGGSIACWFGPIYNLELYLQFNKRLPRPGQKAGRVTIHHFVCVDTLEEEVLEVLSRKEADQDALVLAVQRRIDKVTGKAV